MIDRNQRPRRSTRNEGIRNARLKLLALAVLCALPLWGCLQLWLAKGTFWPALLYGLASPVAFFLYWRDKHSARNGHWRTPESTLHLTELLGGWPGALLAQQAFRHKTRKLSFQVPFWIIVALHQAIWIDYLYLRAVFGSTFVQRFIG